MRRGMSAFLLGTVVNGSRFPVRGIVQPRTFARGRGRVCEWRGKILHDGDESVCNRARHSDSGLFWRPISRSSRRLLRSASHWFDRFYFVSLVPTSSLALYTVPYLTCHSNINHSSAFGGPSRTPIHVTSPHFLAHHLLDHVATRLDAKWSSAGLAGTTTKPGGKKISNWVSWG